MQYRKLGVSNLKVSVLSFGAWQLGDPGYWGSSPPIRPGEAVRAAIDGGINLFDTAEVYGNGESERLLGQALGADRKRVLIASKVLPQNCAPARLRASCEASLRRLGTDYIDLYQVHWPFRNRPVLDLQGRPVPDPPDVISACETLRALQNEGKIRFIGLSNFGPEDMEDWFFHGVADANQIGYNLISRAAEFDVIPSCRAHQLGVLAYMPLMQGLLAHRWDSVEALPVARRRTRHFSGRREGVRHGEPGHETLLLETVTALRSFSDAIGVPLATVSVCWVLAQPGVTSAIVGARSPEQVQRNLRAALLNLGPAAIAQLNEISGPLKRAMGKNADLWQGEKASRIG
ncbi:MAG: aldo/keto reductase [Candidatus Hydrogenedentes bacterium]|nr:aldo/keto reductase [Candidatus Hydrogenedentota bacterium]